MTSIIAARSEAQFEQIRLLWREYRADVEALTLADGTCG